MAKIYSYPEGFVSPDFVEAEDIAKYRKEVEEFEIKLGDFCKQNSKCPDAGKIMSFGVADGKARYMVFNYTSLIHLDAFDGYQISESQARGLRKADIVSMANRVPFSELFASKNK